MRSNRPSAGSVRRTRSAGGPRARSRRRSSCRPHSPARSPSPAAEATASTDPGAQLLADPVLERVELRRRPCPRIPGRRPRRQRPPDCLAMQARASADLADREPLDAMHPPDLRPLLHADHTLPPRPTTRSGEGPNPAGRHRPRAGGSLFDRRSRVSIQAAPTLHRRHHEIMGSQRRTSGITIRRARATRGPRAAPSRDDLGCLGDEAVLVQSKEPPDGSRARSSRPPAPSPARPGELNSKFCAEELTPMTAYIASR